MIRCVAIDDEPLALRQIKSYMERIPHLELVALCSSAIEAQELLQREKIDLMFVDINMPDLNGVDFVKGLSQAPLTIFTTAYSEYAIEGYRLDAVDYLLKPFSFEDFARAVNKARSLCELFRLRDSQAPLESEALPASETLAEQEVDSTQIASVGGEELQQTPSSEVENECISIKADYKVSLVKYADIIYIESVGEYLRMHLQNGSSITTLFRLKNMEKALPSDRFMRVHRSYIVNLAHVSGYARGRVYLDNKEYVPISINYRDTFREYINRLHPSTVI